MISTLADAASALRIDAIHYDFTQAFPPPDDAALHRAGRQGMLDQKEDPDASDAAWLALQHQCWRDELCAYGEIIAWLTHCLAQGLDAASAARPRASAQWPALQASMTNEVARCQHQRRALLADYACHFGDEAAQRFDQYAQGQCRSIAPAQTPLF